MVNLVFSDVFHFVFLIEALWEEGEAIKKNVNDSGHYSDEVTQALDKALLSIADIYDDDIDNAKELIKNLRMEAINLTK